jgi:hypothetical protein
LQVFCNTINDDYKAFPAAKVNLYVLFFVEYLKNVRMGNINEAGIKNMQKAINWMGKNQGVVDITELVRGCYALCGSVCLSTCPLCAVSEVSELAQHTTHAVVR